MIGIDSELLSRFDNYKLANKVLSVEETVYFNSLEGKKKQRFLASRFCAKEAIFKAIGIGITTIKFKDITILNNELGKPIVKLANYNIELSITYNDLFVIAIAVLK